jgi:very-short-patch-repair endonuclease
MHGDLARLATRQGGFFYRWQAVECGYGAEEIEKLLGSEWARVRRGAYATRELWNSLGAQARHVLRVRAVVGNLSGRVVVSGYSALAVMGVSLWGVDLNEVQVHRDPEKTSRREAGVAHHLGVLPSSDVVEVGGLLVAAPERAVVEACRRTDFETGVVLADGARRLAGFDLDRAFGVLERQRDCSGARTASRALRFSDGRAATVGESRARLLMARLGLPRPELQVPISDDEGELIGIVDFAIRDQCTVVEFDGKQKYGRRLYETTGRLNDVDLGDVVWQEKRREDSLRDQGYEVVRLVWSELDGRDGPVHARFQRAFARAARRTAS